MGNITKVVYVNFYKILFYKYFYKLTPAFQGSTFLWWYCYKTARLNPGFPEKHSRIISAFQFHLTGYTSSVFQDFFFQNIRGSAT